MSPATKTPAKKPAKSPAKAPAGAPARAPQGKRAGAQTQAEVVTSEAPPNFLRKYREEVEAKLHDEFDYDNVMQIPRIVKVVVNVGVGEGKDDNKALESTVNDIRTITGQQPVVVRAKRSVAAFKLRAGQPVGVKATLRGRRMWYFLERLIMIGLPRIRDFRGVPATFDGRGNYSLGLREQILFPEIEYDKIDKLRGMEITIVTTAATDREARALLGHLGMPFRKGA